VQVAILGWRKLSALVARSLTLVAILPRAPLIAASSSSPLVSTTSPAAIAPSLVVEGLMHTSILCEPQLLQIHALLALELLFLKELMDGHGQRQSLERRNVALGSC
jgi:hypothetical protein